MFDVIFYLNDYQFSEEFDELADAIKCAVSISKGLTVEVWTGEEIHEYRDRLYIQTRSI